MADEKVLEIYRQRYATFRHLDRLRWQLLQTLGVGLIAFVINANGSASSASSAWWALLGCMFLIFGIVLKRIRKGLNENNEVLREVAIHKGDKGIPTDSKLWLSRAGWIAWILIIIGVTCIIISIRMLVK